MTASAPGAGILLACILLLGNATTLAGDALDPADPIDNMAIEIGMACSSTDPDAPHYYFWTGELYSRRSGEPDRHLFNVQGVNPRACKLLEDPERGGSGYLSTGRELMLYLDPVTNEVLEEWDNPWTGERVAVAHMQNDPANSPATFPFMPDGQPRRVRFSWTELGGSLVSVRTRRVFRENPMGGDYQEYVGGHLHAFESSRMIVSAGSLQEHESGRHIPYIATWTRISQWLPWMRMGSRDGGIVMATHGSGTNDFAALPEPLRSAVAQDYPLMRRTPPFDDTRPFVTSWYSLKRWIDARREAAEP